MDFKFQFEQFTNKDDIEFMNNRKIYQGNI